MKENGTSNVPVWFKVTSVLFLLWNLFGLAVFVMAVFVYTSAEALENAGMNAAQTELILATPTWVNVAFGVAVIFGVLGSAALVMQKRLAVPLLAISLIGVLAQNTFVFLLSDTVAIMGVGAAPAVIVGAVAVLGMAVLGQTKHWLG